MGTKGKGGSFEREMCKELSLWWTHQERDDVFWRTSTSGGRATIRRKQGKSTYGQSGDIQAVDPIGKPLMDLVTIECKRGYSGTSIGSTLADVLEKTRGTSIFREFIEQAEEESKNAGTPYWWLITRRDNKEPLVTMPSDMFALIVKLRLDNFTPLPECMLTTFYMEGKPYEVMSLRLYDFWDRAAISIIKKIHKNYVQLKDKSRQSNSDEE